MINPLSRFCSVLSVVGLATLLSSCGEDVIDSPERKESWETVSVPTSSTLIDVYHTNAATVTAVGVGGTIIHSVDSGKTWAKRNSGVGDDLFYIENFESEGLLAIGGPRVIGSNNGGLSWSLRASVDASYKLRSIGTNGEDIFLVGADVDGDQGFILRVPNIGGSYQTVLLNDHDGIYGIRFFDAMRGVAVGKLSRVYLTSNGGSSWSMLPQLAGGHQFTGVEILDDGSAITWGGTFEGGSEGPGGIIFRSTDRGSTWTQVHNGANRIERISFSGNDGVAVGVNGLAMKTLDGGKTWSPYDALGSSYWRSISLYRKGQATMVGENGKVARLSEK